MGSQGSQGGSLGIFNGCGFGHTLRVWSNGCGEWLDGSGLTHPVAILKIKARECGQMCVVRG